MAGQPKRGLDYVGWNVRIFEDDTRIDTLIDSQGWIGYVIYHYLFLKASASDGYFYRWSYSNAATTARKMGGGIRSDTVKQTVSLCLRLGLFDHRLFDREGILTSKEIQIRYMLAIEKRSASGRTIEPKYWLLNREETRGYIIVPENTDSLPENDDSLPENTTKQSKANKSKLKQNNRDDFYIPPDRRTYENISSSYRSATGRCLTDNDIEVINELREEGITDDVIITTIYEVSRKTTKKINSLRYFKQAIENKTGRSGFCYPSTYSTSDIEAVLDAEWKAECDAAGDIEYTYDD